MKIYNGKLFVEPGLTPIIIVTKYRLIKYYVFFQNDFLIHEKKIIGNVKIVGYTSFSKSRPNDKMQLNIDGVNFSVYNVSQYKPFAYLSVGNNEYIVIEKKFFSSKRFFISL